MNYYFEDPSKQEELYQELESWIGTPFKHRMGTKGLGCDCFVFWMKVMEAVGVLVPGMTRLPKYDVNWCLHRGEEILLDRVRSHPAAVEIGLDEPMDGDIYLYQFGRVCGHSAIYCRGQLYHAITGSCVKATPWLDGIFTPRLKYGFRVVAK
jgi:cell wall-associated NlpC family hydrolase